MKTFLYAVTLAIILYLWYFIISTFWENLPEQTKAARMCLAEGGEWYYAKCIPRE